MSESIWVGIDIGTQSVRAIAVSDSGEILASHAHQLESHREGKIHEQNPRSWMDATNNCLQQITSEVSTHAIRGLAISGTSGTIVVVDQDGNPATPGLMYDDGRAEKFALLAQETDPEYWSRLGYKVQGSWAICKMAWLAEQGLLNAGNKVITQPDFISWGLSGRQLPSDTSHSLKSGFDLDKLEWPVNLLSNLKIPVNSLNEVVVSGEIIGNVSREASETTGLPVGCVIVAGMTDGCAAQLSAGALSPGDWNSVLGTTLVLKGASTTRLRDTTGSVYAHLAPFHTGWWPGGASSTGASAINKWLADVPVEQLVFTNSELKNSPILYPLAGSGERFPFVSTEAHHFAINGQVPDQSRNGIQETFASIAKGLAFIERLCFDLLLLTGYSISGRITFTGGGANNPIWTQLRADVLERNVSVLDSKEGAVGMAILAAAALSEQLSDEEKLAVTASRMLGSEKLVHFNPATSEWLKQQYRLFIWELYRRGWITNELVNFAETRAS